MLFVTLVAATLAGSDALEACCAAADRKRCPSDDLVAVGPGSRVMRAGNDQSVVGLWVVSCDAGPQWDATATRPIASEPDQGTILGELTENMTACWDATCRLPTNLCLRWDGDHAVAVHCMSGLAAGASTWQSAAEGHAAAAVITGKVLKVQGHIPPPVPMVTSTTGPPDPPPRAATPTEPRSAVIGGHSTTSAAKGSEAAPGAALPAVPSMPCRPPPNAMDARPLTDDGNAAAMRGQWSYAIGRYRAALGIDPCNAFAWADLGEALLATGRAGDAQTALSAATTLMVEHYRAWTLLGDARERLGQSSEAVEAYRRALQIQPGYSPAKDGVERASRR